MEDPKLQRINMINWWNELKRIGHFKLWKTYEEWEKRNEPKKEKKD